MKKEKQKTMKPMAPKKKDMKSNALRILILEDNPADAELMERQLRRDRIAFTSQRAETRAHFIKALNSFEPDLVLADYTLPGFDAMKALALARKKSPFIPFIVVTGSIGEEKAVSCLRAGANNYLLKDRLAPLGEAVQQAREKHRLQMEKENVDTMLKAAAERWRTTFDSMNDAVCLLDANGAVLQCNRAMKRLLELPFSQIIGRDCPDLICGKENNKSCAFTRMMKTRQCMEEETFWRNHWYQVRVDPVSGPAGKLVGAVHIMTDITRQKESEKALRDSEAYYRDLFTNSLIGISQALPDGRLIRCNLAYARMYGYATPEECVAAMTDIGSQVYSDPEDRRNVLARLRLKGVMEPTEITVRHRDGSLFVVLAGAREVRDADGRLVCYQAEHVDVTPLKKTEAALQEVNEIFRLFLKHNPIFVFIKDENIRPIYLSENYEKLLGRPLNELLGKSMDQLFPSELSRIMVEDDRRVLREGKPDEFLEEFDGRTYFTIKFPIFIAGKAKYLAGFTTDITERKKTEDALRDSEIRYRNHFENSSEFYFTLDLKGNFIEVNKAAVTLTGHKKSELLKMNFKDYTPKRDHRKLFHTLSQVYKTGKPFENFLVEAVIKDKSTKYFETNFSLLKENERIIGFKGSSKDITERKHAEEQIQASLFEKEVLLKEIHHRVKNNLQVISGLLTLQAQQIDDERLKNILKDSQSRIWTMALIHQTLYQSGNLAAINMADYVHGLAGNLLSAHARMAMPPTVIFDLLPIRLSIDKAIPLALIINELLTNAMKHAFSAGQAGEIRIALQKYKGTPPPRHARTQATDTTPREGIVPCTSTYELKVADNGTGLPADFDPKNQKSLGLQLVTMLTKQLDGMLAVESKGGTSVRIIFSADEKNHKQS